MTPVMKGVRSLIFTMPEAMTNSVGSLNRTMTSQCAGTITIEKSKSVKTKRVGNEADNRIMRWLGVP